jgi:hypothetical protein
MFNYNIDKHNLSEIRSLKLTRNQIYPKYTNLEKFNFLIDTKNIKIFKNKSKISSIGTCFARNIKDYLIKNNYKYMVLAEGPCTKHSSARFDRVFNTSCLLKELIRSQNGFKEPYLWELSHNKKKILLNPFRKNLCYDNKKEFEDEIIQHQLNVKKIVDISDILILTVGQSEIVRCKKSNFVFAQVPPAEIYDKELHSFETLNEKQNLENLSQIVEIVKKNINLKIILIVSPIPLRATFRKDSDSIQSNFENKFALIKVAKKLASLNSNVSYFPSFEMVYSLRDPFLEDARHLKEEAITYVMSQFVGKYVFQ